MERGGFHAGEGMWRAVHVDRDNPASAAPAVAAAWRDSGFAGGTRIKTQRGEVRVENLRPGDRVLTRDNGYQALRWVLGVAPGPAYPPVIRIRKGALGRGAPERVLRVAPGHRLLLGGPRVRRRTGLPEVLVPARRLTGLAGIGPAPATGTPCLHLLFDHHELLLSEGAWAESLHVTPDVMDRLPAPARLAQEPAGQHPGGVPPARPAISRQDLRSVLDGVVLPPADDP